MKRKHRQLGKRTKYKCWYCGVHPAKRSDWTIDHKDPKSLGGSDDREANLVLACLKCNREKDDMDVETYRYFLQNRLALGERVIFYGERIAMEMSV